MARSCNGSTQYLTRTATYLANSPGPFTISLWFAPANLTDTVKAVLANATGSPWWQLRLDAGVVVFESSGYTGSNPGTGSGITWPATSLKHVAWRYKGQGAEWSKWDHGAKSVINAAISFTLPNVGARFDIARNWSGAHCAGTYAEVAIWNVALPDEYMAELAAGVAADQLHRPGLIAYFPLRGNSSPEPNYAVPADTLTLGNAPAQAAHPEIVPPWHADRSAPAWVLDLFHANGTKRIASTDLTEDVDVDVLGATYTHRLLNDPPLSESDPSDHGGGVMIPGQTTVEIANPDGYLDRSWEWRQCPMRLRAYDRVSHALVTELVGIVTDPGNMANERMVFQCASDDEALLDQPLPRQVIEVGAAGSALLDDTDLLDLRRMDVGRPIPLVFGRALVVLPFLKEQVADPGGGDFIVGWGDDLVVSNLWFDTDAYTPGLEPGLPFSPAPGTPTSATTTTFTVTGDQSKVYTPGKSARRSGDGGATWAYSEVVSYASGTVTLRDAILPASPTAIGLVEIGGDFDVEHDRWKYVGINTTFLTTVRFPAVPHAVVIAEVNRSAVANPADAIKFLFEDPDQGLGQPCNAASFAQAAADFTAAGLGAAANGHVGGDGAQRQALGAINELCALRGCEVWKDPDTGERMIRVDTAPVVQTRTLEFGPDTKGNIAEVLSLASTPLAQATGLLTLRYGAGGRSRRGNFFQQDYSYQASMTVLSGAGAVRRTIESQFLTYDRAVGAGHRAAARVLYYRAKRLQLADRQLVFRMVGPLGRRVRRGQVYPFLIPKDGLATPTNFRIVARERTLNEFTFRAVGPYDVNIIYDTNISNILAAVTVPTEEALPEDAPKYRNPVNLLLNADFSTGLRKAGVPAATDLLTLPNWIVSLPGLGTLTALSVTRDARVVGGHYLTIGVGTASTGITLIAWSNPADTTSGYAVVGGALYLFSVYLDSTVAGGPTAGWAMEVNWRDAAGTFVANNVLGQIRPVPGEINGFGHQRYYGVVRAPASAAWVAPYLRFTVSGATYTLSAVQFEEQGNIFGRPGAWTRNAPHGIEPTSMRPGDQSVRVDGDPEAGASMQQTKGTGYDGGGVTLSGTSTVVGTAGPGLLKGMAGRVTTAVAGPAAWQLALDFGGGVLTPFLDDLPVALHSTFGDDKAVSGPITLRAAVNIVAIPASGSFSAGKVKVFANVERTIPPTS